MPAVQETVDRVRQIDVDQYRYGFETIIDPPSVGYETCAYIGFILNDPTKFDEVVERLKAIPEVVDCHFTTGSYDVFAKIFAHNNAHLLEVIHKKLRLGIGRTETLISFKEVFKRSIPILHENME